MRPPAVAGVGGVIDLAALLGFVLACLAAATTAAVFRPGRWYEALEKPAWRPPNWLFAPAWLALYAMIAVSGWLVWLAAGFGGATAALSIYALQLFLNAAWSPIFFGLRRPGLAFIEMACLWAAILATIAAFHPISETAAYLLIPYAGWVAFAMTLNFSIWRLNPQASAAPT